MFLKIFNGDEVIIYQDIDKTFFRTRSEDGLMTLQFDISPYHPQYKYFALYTQIEYDDQLYLITGINERKTVSTINCDLDLTGLSSQVYRSFIRNNETFKNTADAILAETGWSISGAASITKKSTIKMEHCTPMEILDFCRNKTSYGASYRFDTKSKTIYIIHPYDKTTPSGVYFTDELNLTELTYKGDATNIVTRLMPLGKDDINISSVSSNGDWYISNHSFTDKVITAIWHDDRYTNPQSLLDDARLKLDDMSKPTQSYIGRIVDLAKLIPDKYGDVLSYDLYDIVTIVDRRRNKRLDHRIVKIKEYPADPTLNTIVLSTKPLKIKTVRKR